MFDEDENESCGYADHITDGVFFLLSVAILAIACYIIVPLINPTWALL